MDSIVLIIIVLVVLFFVYAVKVNNDSSGAGESPKLVLGDEFLSHSSAEPIRKTESNHAISTIYMYPEDGNVWTCPNCECENDRDAVKCCVCNGPK